MEAAVVESPIFFNSGARPLRDQKSQSKVTPASIAVGILVSPRALSRDGSISGSVCPCALTPSRFGSCVKAIRMAEAVMKPVTTGCDMKFATKPSLNRPSTSSRAPTMKASVIAAMT